MRATNMARTHVGWSDLVPSDFSDAILSHHSDLVVLNRYSESSHEYLGPGHACLHAYDVLFVASNI